MVDYLYTYLEFIEKNYTGDNRLKESININLDVVGFSRGAASARMFANKISAIMTKGYWYHYDQDFKGNAIDITMKNWKYTDDWFKQNCNINFKFNFMGLWDTVPAYGTDEDDDIAQTKNFGMELGNPWRFKKIVHAVAVNEHRYQFHGRSIFDNQEQADKFANSDSIIERGFMGAHSDIGGGYKEGDLSDVSLMWVIQEAKNAGIKFNDNLISQEEWDKVTNPIVHDSIGVTRGSGTIIFTPGREFRWVGTDVKRHEGELQNSTFKHLRLNWEDTLQFQPDGLKQFQEIRDLQTKYQQNNNSGCGYIIINCNETKEIIKLKGQDGEKQPTILYGPGDKTDNHHYININDYINWLRTVGQYGLSNLKN